jgi:hypothetical protein
VASYTRGESRRQRRVVAALHVFTVIASGPPFGDLIDRRENEAVLDPGLMHVTM